MPFSGRLIFFVALLWELFSPPKEGGGAKTGGQGAEMIEFRGGIKVRLRLTRVRA
ncbi:hypothetical protein VN12_11255 [Pirellula sp. SH-Sr6A]|nr:hypothetical protein VN12_11255 [Pirellula sp. SH-Sr6A]